MPSSSALCASIGPSTTSPIAYIFETLVYQCLLISIFPNLFAYKPAFDNSNPSVYGFLPIDNSTTSDSRVYFPFGPETTHFTPLSLLLVPPSSFVFIMNFIPYYVSIF